MNLPSIPSPNSHAGDEVARLPIAIVSISGGKDSTATALVAIDRYGRERVRLVYADTGHEHPITTDYVQNYLPDALGLPVHTVRGNFDKDIARKRVFMAEKWPEMGVPADIVARALAVLHPTGIPFLDLCIWKGRFPSRRAQFCTEFTKRVPLDLFTVGAAKDAGGVDAIESWQGVRRDESQARKDALEWERSDWGWMIHRPIVDWTAADTFACMASHGVSPNPLYSQGRKRVGCSPCINCDKDELHQTGQRDPQEIKRVREWESIVSDASKRGYSTLFHVSADEGESDTSVFARANINERVRWAATSRGGTQFDLERAIPSPACSSVYGLCE